MSDSAFLDTNVVVYAFDDDEPDKQERARQILAAPAERILVVSTQVLAEFYVTVTRKLARPLDHASARLALDELARLPVVNTDTDLVLAAADLAHQHELSLWDSLIVQAASIAGSQVLLTEDLSDGATLAGVRIENPFEGLSTPA